MKVRITFTSEVVLEGKDINDVKYKWENLWLYSDEAKASHADFIEISNVEDANTNKDLSGDW